MLLNAMIYIDVWLVLGYPTSEMNVKRSTQIKVLNKEEIEGMRTVCRVGNFVIIIMKENHNATRQVIKNRKQERLDLP